MTVILKDSGGVVKYTNSWVWVSSWGGGFSAWMGTIIAPTDRIQVTDGTTTKTMTVQNLTTQLDNDTGHLFGSAYNGHLLVELDDFRRVRRGRAIR